MAGKGGERMAGQTYTTTHPNPRQTPAASVVFPLSLSLFYKQKHHTPVSLRVLPAVAPCGLTDSLARSLDLALVIPLDDGGVAQPTVGTSRDEGILAALAVAIETSHGKSTNSRNIIN